MKRLFAEVALGAPPPGDPSLRGYVRNTRWSGRKETRNRKVQSIRRDAEHAHEMLRVHTPLTSPKEMTALKAQQAATKAQMEGRPTNYREWDKQLQAKLNRELEDRKARALSHAKAGERMRQLGARAREYHH